MAKTKKVVGERPRANAIEEGKPGEAAAVWVPVGNLKPWKENPRNNDHAVPRVVQSIKAHGFGAPLTARKANGELIAGHTRLKAAIELGMAAVPVRLLDVDEATAHRLARADNRTGEFAEWQTDLLVEQLEADLALDGASAIEVQGWSQDELDAIIRSTPPPVTYGDEDLENKAPRFGMGSVTKAELLMIGRFLAGVEKSLLRATEDQLNAIKGDTGTPEAVAERLCRAILRWSGGADL